MPFCENCGAPLGEGQNFCPECGHKVPRPATSGSVDDSTRSDSVERTTEEIAHPTLSPVVDDQPLSETTADSMAGTTNVETHDEPVSENEPSPKNEDGESVEEPRDAFDEDVASKAVETDQARSQVTPDLTETREPADRAEPGGRPKQTNFGRIALIIILILVAFVAFVIISARVRNSSSAEDTQTTQEQPAEQEQQGEQEQQEQAEPETVDKKALQALTDSAAADYSPADYSADSFSALQSAITNARDVLADDAATQEQVDSAVAAITTAKSSLVKVFNPDPYVWYDYESIARNPDSYEGKKMAFVGKVAQVIEGDGETDIRLAVDDYYNDIIYVYFASDIIDFRVLDDDVLTVYGTGEGLYTYESTMGNSVSVPLMQADHVELYTQ